MPIYEYKCDGCGLKSEMFQNMTDLHEAVCTECGEDMKRVWGNIPFRFGTKPAYFDPKRAAMDANYAREAHFKYDKSAHK